MTDRPPWETEPDSLEFEAEGLRCVMLRNHFGIWCGYVGVDRDHPLHGLPTNHPLKLPMSWFEGRRGLEGSGPMDLFLHIVRGKKLDDACEISLALQVHGGVNFGEDHVPDREPDGRWWFGFDCGHGGDYMPKLPFSVAQITGEIIASMPEHVRGTMREIMSKTAAQTGDYRDQQYVVSECQSLAAQLNAIVRVLDREETHGGTGDQRA